VKLMIDQSVKVRHEERLATTSELNPASGVMSLCLDFHSGLVYASLVAQPMEYQVLTRDSEGYPKRLLERLGGDAPVELYYHGPLSFLSRFTMAFMCADALDARGFMETNQLLFTIREYDLNYIGGWHSWMETEVFRLGLFFPHPTVTVFTAKGLGHETSDSYLLDRFYPPLDDFPERDEYYRRANAGQLLVLSLVPPETARTARRNVVERNWIACALSDVVFIPYAPKGSKTYSLAKRIKAAGWPIFTLAHELASDTLGLDIPGLSRKTVGPFLERLGARVGGSRPAVEDTIQPTSDRSVEKTVRIIQCEIPYPSSQTSRVEVRHRRAKRRLETAHEYQPPMPADRRR
jgi:hypothetical protein